MEEIRKILEDSIRSSARTVQECWGSGSNREKFRAQFDDAVNQAVEILGITDKNAWLTGLGVEL